MFFKTIREEPFKTLKKCKFGVFLPLVLITTLLNSKRIIKHYLEILTFLIIKKLGLPLKKSKSGKKSTKMSKKVIFVTFDFFK